MGCDTSMKTRIIFYGSLILVAGLVSSYYMADAQSGFWYPSSNYLRPVVSTWGLQIPQLASCDTIDTNASGQLSCGTDAGGSSNWEFTPGESAIRPTSTIGIIVSASSTFSTSIATPLIYSPESSTTYIDQINRQFYTAGNKSLDYGSRKLYTAGNIESINWNNRYLADQAGTNVLDYELGNIGIASTTPFKKFSVSGDSWFSGNSTTTGSHYVIGVLDSTGGLRTASTTISGHLAVQTSIDLPDDSITDAMID